MSSLLLKISGKKVGFRERLKAHEDRKKVVFSMVKLIILVHHGYNFILPVEILYI